MASKEKVGKKGQVIHSQAREIIYNVLQFFKEEAQNNGPMIPITNFKERVLKATGISRSSYGRIVRQSKSQGDAYTEEPVAGTSFSSPGKKRKYEKPKMYSVNEGEITMIRQIVNNYYITEKCRPSLKKVYRRIIDANIGFTGGISSFRSLLIRMGFKWQKTFDNRSTLVESHRIRSLRVNYLKKIMAYRNEGYNIIYTDETYLHSSHAASFSWFDTTSPHAGLKKPASKGKRLIIVHAGGEGGFIPNGLLMFRSGSKSGDYHDEMNHMNFMKWVRQHLIPNLHAPSVLVLDNASYHNVKEGVTVTSASRKADMVNWLTANKIAFNENLLKVELYNLIKMHKDKNTKYVLDTVMEQHGHQVLRLPPYHPDLNPIEKIWASVKNWVGQNNTTFKLEDVEKLTIQRFNMLSDATCHQWKSICDHVIKYEKELINKEGILDDALEELIFSVNTGSSDDESFEDSSDESEEEVEV